MPKRDRVREKGIDRGLEEQGEVGREKEMD